MSLTVLHLNLMKLRYPFISLTLGLTFKLDETETNPHGTHSLTLKLDETETNPHVTQSHTSLMRLRQIHIVLTHTSDEIQTYSHVNSTQI